MSYPRVLVVCHHFEPSASTGALRSTRLARFLASRGSLPVVVAAAPAFYGQDVFRDSGAREQFDVFEVPHGSVFRALDGCGAAGRQAENMALMLAYGRTIEAALRSGPRPDLLYFCGHPFWYFPLARHFRQRDGLPYALDFADVFYMRGLQYRSGQRSGVRHHVDRLAEAWAVAGAGLLIHTTDAQTRIYRKRYPRKAPEQFVTVRWGYDADRVPPAAPVARSKGAAFRVAIFGKFATYGAADARMLARAAGRLRARYPVEVIHVGKREKELEVAFRQEGLADCFKPMGLRPYEEGMQIVASADCLVLNAISDVSLPVKVYDYIRLNKPVVALVARDSAAAGLLRRFSGAFVVQTARQVGDAFRKILTGPIRHLAPKLDPTEFSQQYQFGGLLEAMCAVTERERKRRD